MSRRSGWFLLIAANLAMYGVLGFLQNAHAQRAAPEMPFANSVEQRIEMVTTLGEIRDLLKEQNALLKSGKLRVVVTLPEKE